MHPQCLGDMKLTFQQLSTHLKNHFLPIYLIVGNEPLFVQEAKDLVFEKAKQLGFLEYQRHEVNKDFNWEVLFEAVSSLSLFGDKTLHELRLHHKPTTSAAKLIAPFIYKLDQENALVILCDKIDSATQKTSWYQAINDQGAVITIWPLEAAAFQQWLKQRLQQQNLGTDPRLVQFIMDQTEGNAIAAAQEIEKLKLLYPNGQVPHQDLENIIVDHARYDIFGLVEVILAGNAARITQVLQKIKAEGIEATLVLWAMTREIRVLINVLQGLKNKDGWDFILKRNNVWGKRSALIKNNISKYRIEQLHQALLHAGKIDKLIKGVAKGNVWDDLQLLALKIGGWDLF
jgi:DNA polymerase-3 subunit delta